jgi:hypothetical protein
MWSLSDAFAWTTNLKDSKQGWTNNPRQDTELTEPLVTRLQQAMVRSRTNLWLQKIQTGRTGVNLHLKTETLTERSKRNFVMPRQ